MVKPLNAIAGGARYACTACGKTYAEWIAAAQCENACRPYEPQHVLEEAVALSAPAEISTEMPEVKAPELLGRAAAHMHERGKTYDAPEGERSMGKAVAAFNAITGHKLIESEGWLLLQVLKDVRLFTRSTYHADSAEDCIAYAALKAEARGEGR